MSLAHALRCCGVDSDFLLDDDPSVRAAITQAGFGTSAVTAEEDLAATVVAGRQRETQAVVVDSYTCTAEYLQRLAARVPAVIVLDDIADRELPVDFVVNGALGAERLPYRGRADTRYLLGPQYLLLRPEFAQEPKRQFHAQTDCLLITVGGDDPQGLTARLVRWAAAVLGPVVIDVVIGPLFQHLQAIEQASQEVPARVTLHFDPPAMRDLMLAADLAICGGGQTTCELAATGTPVVAIRLADNQGPNLEGLAAAGALLSAGDARDADLESRVERALAALAEDPVLRASMSARGRALVDGRGASRVAGAISDITGRP
jgi:spore coat polysaccharide biosynthesis predicted glycosyltransferase SpsG